MRADLERVECGSAGEWRRWLEKHHRSSAGIWLVFFKGRSRAASIPYEEAVREALCFGWIDSLVKRLDEKRYLRKFTPRQPESKWSDINRRRWTELQAAGRLSPAGRAMPPTSNRYAARPEVPELPAYIEKAFRSEPAAWRFFQSLAPTYRRHFVGWIHTAKRPETRERRIRESIALLKAEKKLGLK